MTLRIVAILLAAIWLATPLHAQTTVQLRTSATVAEVRVITLADVASITGPEAATLGQIVVRSAAEGRAGDSDLTIASVRAALDAAKVNWGQVALRGSACRLRLGDAPDALDTAGSSRSPVPHNSLEPVHQLVDLSGPPTVRSAVVMRLCSLLGAEPQGLRVRFRAEDEPLLSQSIVSRRVDTQTGATRSSSRMSVQVYVYEGDRIAISGTIVVDALVLREVFSATTPIERGDVIRADLVVAGSQWIEPNARTPAQGGNVIGSVARSRISAGAVISLTDIEPALIAKRGDLIWVHCLSGSVNLKAKARVVADAHDGGLVSLRLEGSKQTFDARMSGPGVAVIDIDKATQAASTSR
ncbi:MAG: flagella basal body P-ring formation protein FlgA [Phycisphaeraceae bacterium]|nr:flagella basal body P-ring formation protein FlgA [Phycisphaeraceae bacterium]